jgi:hypothetical protein
MNGQDVDLSDSAAEVKDVSGNGNDGNAKNGASPAIGKLGQGYGFDGTDDYIQVSDDSSLDVSSEFTLSAWVYPQNVSGNHSVFRKYNAYTLYYSSELDFYNWADNTRLKCPTANTPENEWSHVTAVWNGQDKIIYVNGKECARESSTDFQTTSSDLGIGQEGDGSAYPFDGTIDNARIYDRALSADEVEKLYRLGE